MSLLYPHDVTLEMLVKLYYDKVDIIERNSKYIAVSVGDKKIACAEKFSKYPDGFDGYFVLAKTSKKEGVVTLKDILKKIPELTFEEKEKSTFVKLKKYLEFHEKYPMIYENEELFHYIRDMCDAKESLPSSEIERLESLPNWHWDYSRLTKEGEKFSEVIKAAEQGVESLDLNHKKTLKLMLSKMERGMLSVYFEDAIRYHGLNL